MSDDEPKLGAYAPPPEDYETFDARDGEPERRGPILLIAAVAVLVLFAALVWNAYRLGVRERGEAPVIVAEDEPYRQRPADPGGYETPGQDIEAYELRSGESRESEAAGVRPGPEEPAARDSDAETQSETGTQTTELPEVRIEPVDADRIDAEDEPAAIEPAPEPEEQAPARAEPEPAPAREAPAPATGTHVVQIAAFRSRAEAEEGWIAFTSRFPELASGRSPSIVEADLGDRGIYYRLRIAGFENRDAATRYCTTLSARGQDCLVAAR